MQYEEFFKIFKLFDCISFFVSFGKTVINIEEEVIITASNTNIPVLQLNGSPYENGFRHGELMKEKIIELIARWKESLERSYKLPADEFVQLFLDSTDYIPAIKK